MHDSILHDIFFIEIQLLKSSQNHLCLGMTKRTLDTYIYGASLNYVGKILSIFDPPPPSVGKFTT